MSVSTHQITPDETETRLDRWLRRHFPGVTQGAIQKWCRTGQVRVDGKLPPGVLGDEMEE